MNDNNVIDEETFVQININNANSTTSSVDFETSLSRIVNGDANITTLTFSKDSVTPLEYLTGTSETYYDQLDDDNMSIDDMDDDDQLKINFYRQIDASGQHRNIDHLLLGDQEFVYESIANQISTCPNIKHLIINGSGDWLCNTDYTYFFGELNPRSTTKLTLIDCSFDGNSLPVLIEIIHLPNLSTIIAHNCNFPEDSVEEIFKHEDYTKLEFIDCTFYRKPKERGPDGKIIDHDIDDEDILLANCLTDCDLLQELTFIRCGLSIKAIRILRGITVNGIRIANIEN